MLRFSRHADGISTIDVDYVRPGLAAAHLIEWNGRAAFVDTGPNHGVPLLLEALGQFGLAPTAVDYVLLTHVHLDHAGGAGLLMRALPNARAVLHPRGAPHLVDPARLIAGSIAVYGAAEYHRLYGDIIPIPAERVLATADGQQLSLAGRTLEFVHTPGHALHHQCIVDPVSSSIFAGDTFGISYREFDTARGPFIFPTTTPTQFDPQQLIASIDRLLGCAPRAMFLMHFGRVEDLARLGEDLKSQVAELAAIALRHATVADRAASIRADMRALWLRRARQHGVTLPEERVDALLGKDLDLNTDGLLAWLERGK
jgi:glyoxylase-like metal-dependent hydrolase (beta-lactamase superfamily II)